MRRFKYIITLMLLIGVLTPAESQSFINMLGKIARNSINSNTNRSRQSYNNGYRNNQTKANTATRNNPPVLKETSEQQELRKRAEALKRVLDADYEPVVLAEWGDYKFGVDYLAEIDYEPAYPKDAIFNDSLYAGAMNGDTNAMYKLAYCYLLGKGTECNKERAVTLFNRLSEKDDCPLWYFVDFYLHSGILIKNDHLTNRAIKEGYAPYISLYDDDTAAKLGYSASIYKKAHLYNGRINLANLPEVEIIPELMIKIKNYPPAQNANATYFAKQKNDYATAYKFIRNIIWDEKYYKYVSYDIRPKLIKYGIENDKNRLEDYRRTIYEQLDHIYVQHNLRDQGELLRLLNASNASLFDDKDLLLRAYTIVYSRDFDADEALLYIKKKQEEGNGLASFLLGFFYYNGTSIIKKDEDKGLALLKESADTQNSEGLFYYGLKLVEKNKLDEALNVLTIANSIGHSGSKEQIDKIEEIKRRNAYIEAEQKAKQAEEKRIADARRATVQKRKEYAQKYGAATQQALDNVQIKVGMPFAAIKEYISVTGKNDYSYKLSIDHGSKKCYDIYIEVIIAQKIGYVWVTNGKITSVVKR